MAEAWTTEKVLADPVPAIGRVEPFAPQVAKPRLVEDLRLRLNPAIARLASADRTLPWEILPSDLGPQQQAPDPTLLRDQLAYWASIFDFDALQAKLARWPHYVADIDWCHRCHFVHQRSSRPDAIPLLLLHGWPSSFYEFWDLIEPLTEPSDPSDPAFHVVIPSLPGFVYSAPPPSGYGQGGNGSIWSGYAVHGTDWGAFVSRALANIPGTAVRAVHTNFFLPAPGQQAHHPQGATPSPRKTSSSPSAGRQREQSKSSRGSSGTYSYYHIQRHRPGALMHALLDSPAGLLCYTTTAAIPFFSKKPSLVSMRATQTGTGYLDLDKYLGTLTLYWQTGCIGTSFLPYVTNEEGARLTSREELKIKQPLAVSDFPRELAHPNMSWVQQHSNLVWAAQSDVGGHFPAMEVPEILASHIRAAFSPSGFLHTTPEDHLRVLVHREGLWDDERVKLSSKDATARL